MSHYCVAVFADSEMDFYRLLAPYSETDERYFQSIPVKNTDFLRSYYEKCKDMYASYAEFLLSHGYRLEEDGSVKRFCNPNAKYDYYSLDSKSYLYDLKPDAMCGDSRPHKKRYRFLG